MERVKKPTTFHLQGEHSNHLTKSRDSYSIVSGLPPSREERKHIQNNKHYIIL